MNTYKFFENMDVGDLLVDEPMKKHTSFKIGGPCDLMIIPKDSNQILTALKIIKDKDLSYRVIGNGSNILVSDKGLREVVIKLNDNFNKIEVAGDLIRAQAGALLSKVSSTATKNSLSGFEEISGIPGGIGGAITMNAGAYGKEIKDTISRVEIINSKLEREVVDKEQMDFSYRHSRIQDEDIIVLSADFKLAKADPEDIQARVDDYTQRRVSKQPLDLPSCGSIFKRPEGHFAGKLITDAGLKGYRYNDAMVSEKHAGFIVNVGDASCEDVVHVIKHVIEVVYEKFEVRLEPEVRIIGEG
ncbi:MAG: UDP-N-acetylmuramate dehydrogenase [Finegoldia sp.]|nr:UDP-N-acetylmuramate dehydrogenase [Finegoldia sp.]